MKDKNTADEMYEEVDDVLELSQSDDNDILSVWGKYKNVIIVCAAILVLAIGGGYYYTKMTAEKEAEASMQLSRIIMYFQAGEYEQALTGNKVPSAQGGRAMGLKAIADEYSSTPAGQLSALYAGNALVELNKGSEALHYFDIADGSGSDLVKLGASAGMAACKELAKDYKAAAEQYTKAAEMAEEPGVKARYTFYSGLCLEKSGDKSGAETKFREVVDTREANEFSGLAKSALTRLGTIIE